MTGATWTELPFYKSIIDNFMVYQDRIETNLLQAFAHLQTSEWFSIILVLIWRSTLLLNRNQYKFDPILLFFYKFALPSTLTLLLPYRCSGIPDDSRTNSDETGSKLRSSI